MVLYMKKKSQLYLISILYTYIYFYVFFLYKKFLIDAFFYEKMSYVNLHISKNCSAVSNKFSDMIT